LDIPRILFRCLVGRQAAAVGTPPGGIDKRAVINTKILAAGNGIAILENGSSTSLAVDPAVPRFLTATATLSFGSISTSSCASSQTFTLTGGAVGDSVAPGWPGGIESGLLGNMWVIAPNTVAVRMCNLSGATLSPASATYRGTVVKSFWTMNWIIQNTRNLWQFSGGEWVWWFALGIRGHPHPAFANECHC
jgi:hypothetical protein